MTRTTDKLQIVAILLAVFMLALVEVGNVNYSSRTDTVPNSFNP